MIDFTRDVMFAFDSVGSLLLYGLFCYFTIVGNLDFPQNRFLLLTTEMGQFVRFNLALLVGMLIIRHLNIKIVSGI